MGVWKKLTGKQDAAPAGRTPQERKRRAKEISGIDRRTSTWLRAGGWTRTEGS
jgi:hypothetical protein